MFRALILEQEPRHWHRSPLFVSHGSSRVDGSFSELTCAHVAHRLGQCIGHTEGLPICAHDVDGMIQSLGFWIQGTGFGHRLFSCCVALALTISGCLSPLLKTRYPKSCSCHRAFPGDSLGCHVSPTGAQGLSLFLLLQLGGYSSNTTYEDFS